MDLNLSQLSQGEGDSERGMKGVCVCVLTCDVHVCVHLSVSLFGLVCAGNECHLYL